VATGGIDSRIAWRRRIGTARPQLASAGSLEHYRFGSNRAHPEPALGQPIIELNDLAKAFAVNGRVLTVFDSLSARIEKGSFLSIVGPSGCGKSTLLKLISGLDMPTRGTVLFYGRPVGGPARGMIYVFQQYTKSIFPWRTVMQNVAFGLAAGRRLGGKEAREKCLEYIRLVGLDGYEHYHPYQLSGGMQQRVCIARALICEPDVLLMDEPFSAVDAMTRAILQELILRIWEKIPVTILFVTHDVDEAVLLSSRVLSLSRAPAAIRGDLTIDLPYPRDQIKTRDDEQFTTLRQRLFASIFLQEKGASATPATEPRP
jgi:NitT/TauT family transport system ATP-binding protein